VEVQERITAVFNVAGFAIYIKISGLILIKNYVHNRINLRIMLNDVFQTIDETDVYSSFQGSTYGMRG
jgi:hypothetical protein